MKTINIPLARTFQLHGKYALLDAVRINSDGIYYYINTRADSMEKVPIEEIKYASNCPYCNILIEGEINEPVLVLYNDKCVEGRIEAIEVYSSDNCWYLISTLYGTTWLRNASIIPLN